MKLKERGVAKIVVCLCAIALLLSPIDKRAVGAFDVFEIYAQDKTYYIYPPEISYGINGVRIIDLDNLCERIYMDTLVKPQNAEIKFLAKGANPFKIKEQKSGLSIPVECAKRQILRAILMGRTSVRLKCEKTDAEITDKELLKRCLLRGKFCTYFGNSSAGRKDNISLCVSKLNGCIVRSGEFFSFNERVGKRSEENGYKNAKVIQNGEFVEGIGGGVCQVSTTLYNALLKSGLTVTECHPHSLSVGYVLPSFDAMVSEVCDLKFENNTLSDIYIYAYCDDANLTICIYGVQNEYEYKLISNVIKKTQPNPLVVQFDSAEGIKEITPKEGIRSEGYISAYKNGELVFSRKIRQDSYKVVDGVIILRENDNEEDVQ